MASVAQQRALLAALGMAEPDEPADESAETEHPDFDGGVRESANVDLDPVGSHNEFVLDLMLGRKKGWL